MIGRYFCDRVTRNQVVAQRPSTMYYATRRLHNDSRRAEPNRQDD
jgi:hypothetical protein